MIPTPTGRARARSARARAPPRLYSLAGLRLTLLLLLLPCCSSRCSCSGLSSFPMFLRLFFRLQCSTLFSLSRFPFHDSQVYFWRQFSLNVALGSLLALSWRGFGAPWAVLGGSRRRTGSQERFRSPPGAILGGFFDDFRCFLEVFRMFIYMPFLIDFQLAFSRKL